MVSSVKANKELVTPYLSISGSSLELGSISWRYYDDLTYCFHRCVGF